MARKRKTYYVVEWTPVDVPYSGFILGKWKGKKFVPLLLPNKKQAERIAEEELESTSFPIRVRVVKINLDEVELYQDSQGRWKYKPKKNNERILAEIDLRGVLW